MALPHVWAIHCQQPALPSLSTDASDFQLISTWMRAIRIKLHTTWEQNWVLQSYHQLIVLRHQRQSLGRRESSEGLDPLPNNVYIIYPHSESLLKLSDQKDHLLKALCTGLNVYILCKKQLSESEQFLEKPQVPCTLILSYSKQLCLTHHQTDLPVICF